MSLHSLREAKTHLPEILSRIAPLEVVEIREGMTLQPEKIFVSPPPVKVSIDNRRFRLHERLASEKVNQTIDYLFTSLAKEVRDKAIGVIMSGTGSDGTEGFKAIDNEGGTTISQDPRTAQFTAMPLNSIEYDHPKFVLHPREMPVIIQRIAAGNLEPVPGPGLRRK